MEVKTNGTGYDAENHQTQESLEAMGTLGRVGIAGSSGIYNGLA